MTIPATDIRRLSERQRHDRAELDAFLDTQLVAHLAATVDSAPIVVPMAYARVGDRVLLHGSSGGGFVLRALAGGAPVAVAVTALDALVFARSLYDSSMNYRSAVLYGVPELLPPDESEAALLAISERLMPGRAAEVRATTRKERAATRVLALDIDRYAMKQRAHGAGEAEDDGEDRTVWAGILPLVTSWGAPETSPLTPAEVPLPASVRALAG